MSKNKHHKKLVFVFLFFAALLIFIFFRVLYIQFAQGEKYRTLSKKRTFRDATIFPNRGNLLAEKGEILASDVTKYDIRMDMVTISKKLFSTQVENLSDSLSKLFGKKTSYWLDYLKKARKNKKRYLLIAKNVKYLHYLKIKKFPIFRSGSYKGGFIAEPKTVRIHPLREIGKRIIGYQAKKGRIGPGIEHAFGNELQGILGKRKEQKIAKNKWRPISFFNQKESKDGQDVITTINASIQIMVHKALLKQLKFFDADHGCAVVMEKKTGQIKAIVNLARTDDNKYYEKRNYAIWESHESGSLFKIPAFLVALKHKVIDTNTVVDTQKGTFRYNNRKIMDTKKGGHGKISASRVLQVSSNIGIVKLITKHYEKNPKKFVNTLYEMGLGKPLILKIKGEGTPIIPHPNSKNWSKIALAWMSFGYGVSLTPLQILTFYNAIANDGKMVKPYFVKALREEGKIIKKFEPILLKKKIATDSNILKIKKVMEHTVKYGTAKNIYHSQFTIAGKTGTAKKYIPAVKNKKGKIIKRGFYSDKNYIASFAGFFPVKNPMYSCIVVIHNPDTRKGYYGAQVAAPVFRKIAQEIYFNIPQKHIVKHNTYSEFNKKYQMQNKTLKKRYKKMPNVVGMPMMDAVALLENLGYKVDFQNTGKVVFQSEKKGNIIKKNKRIYLK